MNLPKDWLFRTEAPPDSGGAGGSGRPRSWSEAGAEPDEESDDIADEDLQAELPNPEILSALERIRQKLLDITSRNPLISFNHGTGKRYLRIANAAPGRIHEHLISGKSFVFTAVPSPGSHQADLLGETQATAIGPRRPPSEEYARQIGMQLTLDLPMHELGIGGRATRLMTPYYPDMLEARLAGIAKLAQTTVEETGTNFLHLVLGFLEWYEREDSTKARYAPLFILSVSLQKAAIDRETNTRLYELSLDSDEVQFNASLAARLKDDWDYILPEPGEETGPDAYLAEVAASVKNRFQNWKVHRWGTLTMLNFSRLLMYRDLDPANWPKDRPLAGHKLVKDVIMGETRSRNEGGRNSAFGEEPEHEIDRMENIHTDFPLVDVADSSQHSALIDVMKGKNLVIQGPPGTGKSQTITNLIAAAINRGQSVLFVSEKMAALEVVARRMNNLGLGAFCLELHSHTTHKLNVMDSLRKRTDSSFPEPRALDISIRQHTALRDKLKQHVERINRPWHKTGKSIHGILTAAVRFRDGLPPELSKLRVSPFDPASWDVSRFDHARLEVRSFHKLLSKIRAKIDGKHPLAAHPWRGLGVNDLDHDATRKLAEALSAWAHSLQALGEAARALTLPAGEFPGNSTADQLLLMAEAALKSPGPNDRVHWSLLPPLKETGMDGLERELTLLASLSRQCASTGKLDHQTLQTRADLDGQSQRVQSLLQTGMRGEHALGSILALPASCHAVMETATAWKNRLAEFAANTSASLPGFMAADALCLRHLRMLQKLIGTAVALPAALHAYRQENLLASRCPGQFEALCSAVETLRAQQAVLAKRFDLPAARNLPDLAGLAHHVPPCSWWKRVFSGTYRQAKKTLQPALVGQKPIWTPESIQSELNQLADHLKREAEFAADPHWRALLGNLFQGVNTDLESVRKLMNWHETLERDYATVEGELFRKWTLGDHGHWLLHADTVVLQQLAVLTQAGLDPAVEDLEQHLGRIARAYGHEGAPQDAQLVNEQDPWRTVMRFILEEAPALTTLDEILSASTSATLESAAQALTRYVDLRQQLGDSLARYAALNQDLFRSVLPSSPWPLEAVSETLRPTHYWLTWLNSPVTPAGLIQHMLRHPGNGAAEEILRWGARVRDAANTETRARQSIADAARMDETLWPLDSDLGTLLARANTALGSLDMIPDYGQFLRMRAWLVEQGLHELRDGMETSDRPLEMWLSAFEHSVYGSHGQVILSQEPELRRFSAISQAEARQEFIETDKKVMDLMRRRVASNVAQRMVPDGTRGARVAELTESELIKHIFDRPRARVTIRQLLLRAGRAVQALVPCFMMGPRSVAQYLAPAGITFDLLVIDEASQMRPSDALGAVARCRQMVVVGDSRQLAPTSFFDHFAEADSEEEDEVSTAEDSDSILDAVASIFPSRSLKWHYRSRHESLIAFSNQNFYDARLQLFPSPLPASGDYGVKYVRVAGGKFAKQVNTAEAKAVVDRVEELLEKDPKLSLGVATMNAKQRDLVERLLEDRAKSNSLLSDALAENADCPEPLFIKNLENVQGDERNVILISGTYGKDPATGKVYQRFGPINGDSGWRRLNVLFTRSRQRMEIFSSMSHLDILTSETSSRGVVALRGMLEYAETNRLKGARISGREPDSDFEVAVASLLSSHGFTVDCQIGVSGFFIDLAVKCPRGTGTYVLGVECDGAAYHSAKSVRDRDRLRQEILEGLGWKIRRIWSTDWFANPHAAIQPILEELKAPVR